MRQLLLLFKGIVRGKTQRGSHSLLLKGVVRGKIQPLFRTYRICTEQAATTLSHVTCVTLVWTSE